MRREQLKGIYEYIGPNKHDSRIVIRPYDVEKIIKSFGRDIVFWLQSARAEKDPIIKTAFEAKAASTKFCLVYFLKWLGGDDV